jgi:hypothetical protein
MLDVTTQQTFPTLGKLKSAILIEFVVTIRFENSEIFGWSFPFSSKKFKMHTLNP